MHALEVEEGPQFNILIIQWVDEDGSRTIPNWNGFHASISLASWCDIAIIRDNPIREIPESRIRQGSPSLEKVMIAYIVEKLSNWFESAERERREAYLATSSDIVQLESRIRSLETNGYSL